MTNVKPDDIIFIGRTLRKREVEMSQRTITMINGVPQLLEGAKPGKIVEFEEGDIVYEKDGSVSQVQGGKRVQIQPRPLGQSPRRVSGGSSITKLG